MTEEAFRLATTADAAALQGIYAPYVENTCISLELIPPTVAEFAGRIERISRDFPYIVHRDGGEITGYAYADRHAERAGYRYNVTVSVYIRPEWHGRGIGRRLYGRLFALLREQGFRTVYGVITVPNEGSVGLHAAMGFAKIGVFPRTGYKNGCWVDVLWMGMDLAAPAVPPPPLKTMAELSGETIGRILAGG